MNLHPQPLFTLYTSRSNVIQSLCHSSESWNLYFPNYMRHYYVYILTNYKKTTLYIGVTNDLMRRLDEHRKGVADGFTKRYNLKYLVYFEETSYVNNAILREKQLKVWQRKWKEELINSLNPEWKDLSDEWGQ